MIDVIRRRFSYFARSATVVLLILAVAYGVTFLFYEVAFPWYFSLPAWKDFSASSKVLCPVWQSSCLYFERPSHNPLGLFLQYVFIKWDIALAIFIGFCSAILLLNISADRVIPRLGVFLSNIPPSRRRFQSILHGRLWPISRAAMWALVAILVFAGPLMFWPDWPKTWTFSQKVFLLLSRASDGGASFILGVITILGVYTTLHQLGDMHASIRSFPELIDRVTSLANMATREDPIHIITYTPALGFLALPPKYWAEYEEAITDKVGPGRAGTKTRMICLNADDLAKWHQSFLGRYNYRGTKIDEKMVDHANRESEKVVREIAHHAFHEDDVEKTDSKSWVDAFVYRTSAEKMPGFYVFCTSHRAIVVNPLFLPFSKLPALGSVETVDMLGFETSDKGVIHDLKAFFRYCAQSCDPVRDPYDLNVDDQKAAAE